MLFGLFTPIVLALGSSETIKNSLSDSGIYDNALSGSFETLSGPEERGSQAPASQKALKKAAATALPPEVLENSARNIIDGTYRWLDGEVEQPDFRVDLSNSKKNFANALADEAEREVKQKPVCTLEQLRTETNINRDDPFELPCRPPDFSLKDVRQKIKQEINQSNDFLNEAVITAQTLSSDDGESIFEQEQIPRTFQVVKRLPWALGAMTIFSGTLIFYLHDDKRRAATIISKSFLTTGLAMIAFVFITNFLSGRITLNEQISASAELKSSLINLLANLVVQINTRFLMIGSLLTMIGGGGLLALYKTRAEQKIDTNVNKDVIDTNSQKRTTGTNHSKEAKSSDPKDNQSEK